MQVPVEITDGLEGLIQMVPFKCLLLVQRQLPRGREDIANLTSIHLLACQLIKVFSQVIQIHVLLFCPHYIKEVLPDQSPRGGAETFIMQGNLDARGECGVKSPHAVTSEDEDTIVVL